MNDFGEDLSDTSATSNSLLFAHTCSCSCTRTTHEKVPTSGTTEVRAPVKPFQDQTTSFWDTTNCKIAIQSLLMQYLRSSILSIPTIFQISKLENRTCDCTCICFMECCRHSFTNKNNCKREFSFAGVFFLFLNDCFSTTAKECEVPFCYF